MKKQTVKLDCPLCSVFMVQVKQSPPSFSCPICHSCFKVAATKSARKQLIEIAQAQLDAKNNFNSKNNNI